MKLTLRAPNRHHLVQVVAVILGNMNSRVEIMATSSLGLMLALLYIIGSIFMMPAYAQINQTVSLVVNASDTGRQMPANLFGLFFEEINHAGAGGLWAELVHNRGFEAGGQNTPSLFDPWAMVGSSTQVTVGTERSSPFERNPIALKVQVLCDPSDASNACPASGAGVSNPGFWGMNIQSGYTYRVQFYVRTTTPSNFSVAFTSNDGTQVLAQRFLSLDTSGAWSKQSLVLSAKSTDHSARLSLTSNTRGVFWLDSVSAMPTNTFKGHGYRMELATMLRDLNPGFLRFPGGCYVEGTVLKNAFRWRDSVGLYENRPGHYGDVWNYWTDDGFGFYEGLQLAEDIGAAPVWVFNSGISHQESVTTDNILPFVQDVLDGLEFARGAANSTWGALRAQMGHPAPFSLQHVAIGNEDCWKPYYKGNYLAFYTAIKLIYPDIQLITNCDGSGGALDQPADLYDYHVYTSANNLFNMRHAFDHTSRTGPKAFVSEYAVTGSDAGKGSLLAALAEGAFLIGLELNSDVVYMASYAPLFVNDNDRTWNPDAIVFNSWQAYGTPSYWVQQFFKHSNGAYLLASTLQANASISTANIVTSTIRAHNSSNGLDYLIVKAVNYGSNPLNLHLMVSGLSTNCVSVADSTMMLMTSGGLMDENSFANPTNVAPTVSKPTNLGSDSQILLPAYSIMALQLGLAPQEDVIGAQTSNQAFKVEKPQQRMAFVA